MLGVLHPAARLYRADTPVAARQGIDQARYQRREIEHATARLIATYLPRERGARLYGFVTGAISERLYDELEKATLNRRAMIASRNGETS